MKHRLTLTLACFALTAGPAWSETEKMPETPLTVCLQPNDPPLSQRGDPSSGFDLQLARTIAHELGRDLRVQWFVSRDDPDANLVKDANALLSDERCQLLAEYPLLEGTLRSPYAPTVKLPPFDGATPDDRRRWVKTHKLSATRPYRADALAIVLPARDANRPVRALADLENKKIGVQIATLADAIAMHYDNGRLIENVVHLPDAPHVFEALEAGTIDAALIDLRAFDAWRGRHGSGGLALSGYLHSLAFNMGFVALDSNMPLINQVDAVLASLEAPDAIAPMAASAGLTFIPPRMPAVHPEVSPEALNGD
jgi:ABC-type amino acid transport substrate-binding protein